MPVQVVSMLNSRANAEGALKFIDEASLDPYVFTRESFLQWRQNLATDGKSEATNDLADFEKDLLDDATTTDDSQKSGLDAQSAKPADENKDLSGKNPNNNASEVHAAISAETSTQSAAQPAKAAAVNTTPVARGDGLQNAAYQDAKKKYELARLEYELLKAEGTMKKSRKTYKAK